MKTLILYASKYGTTGEIARKLAQKLGNATVHDLKAGNAPALANFDCVIVGSSVYAGRLRKEARAYVAKNAGELSKKTLGLFVSSLDVNINFFNKNYPIGFPNVAKTKGFLGGAFDPQKGNAAERLVIKYITRQSGFVTTVDEDAIEQFVAAIKE